eukprot:gene34700-42019_t
MLSLFILNLLLLLIIAECGDLARECEAWAKDLGCVEKAELMWLACPQSCLQYSAKDLHADCQEWADRGECVSNPVLMHLECPQACGLQIAYNLEVRQTLGIPLQLTSELDSLYDMHAAAPDTLQGILDIHRRRLNRYIEGQANTLYAYNVPAPPVTPSLAVYTQLTVRHVSRLLLYMLRIFHVICAHSQEKACLEVVDTHIFSLKQRNSGDDFVLRNLHVYVSHLNELHEYVSSNHSGILPLETSQLPSLVHPLCKASPPSPLCADTLPSHAYSAYLRNAEALAFAPMDPDASIWTLPRSHAVSLAPGNGAKIRLPPLVLSVPEQSLDSELSVATSVGYRAFHLRYAALPLLTSLAQQLRNSQPHSNPGSGSEQQSRVYVFVTLPALPQGYASLSQCVLDILSTHLAGENRRAWRLVVLLDLTNDAVEATYAAYAELLQLHRTHKLYAWGVSLDNSHSDSYGEGYEDVALQRLRDWLVGIKSQQLLLPPLLLTPLSAYTHPAYLPELRALLPLAHILVTNTLQSGAFAAKALSDPLVRYAAKRHTHFVHTQLAAELGKGRRRKGSRGPGSASSDGYADVLGYQDGYDYDANDGYGDGYDGYDVYDDYGYEGQGLDNSTAASAASPIDEVFDHMHRSGLSLSQRTTQWAGENSGLGDGTTSPALAYTTPAQLLLRHFLEQNCSVLVSSADAVHLEEDFFALELVPMTNLQHRLVESLAYLVHMDD